MPLVRVSMRQGKSPAYRQAIRDAVYAAMRETFAVPEDDRFIVVHEHDRDGFDYSPSYLGMVRSDDLLMIQITCNDTRTVEQKKALYARIAERLAKEPGVRPDDVFINLLEVAKENWSFGRGVAQYA